MLNSELFNRLKNAIIIRDKQMIDLYLKDASNNQLNDILQILVDSLPKDPMTIRTSLDRESILLVKKVIKLGADPEPHRILLELGLFTGSLRFVSDILNKGGYPHPGLISAAVLSGKLDIVTFWFDKMVKNVGQERLLQHIQNGLSIALLVDNNKLIDFLISKGGVYIQEHFILLSITCNLSRIHEIEKYIKPTINTGYISINKIINSTTNILAEDLTVKYLSVKLQPFKKRLKLLDYWLYYPLSYTSEQLDELVYNAYYNDRRFLHILEIRGGKPTKDLLLSSFGIKNGEYISEIADVDNGLRWLKKYDEYKTEDLISNIIEVMVTNRVLDVASLIFSRYGDYYVGNDQIVSLTNYIFETFDEEFLEYFLKYTHGVVDRFINTYLRNDIPLESINDESLISNEEVINTLNGLDMAMSKIPPLEKSITTYRGVYVGNSKVINDPAFISTTLDKNYANGIVQQEYDDLYRNSGNTKCCVLEIHVPAGSKVLPLFMFSEFPFQKEILLDRNGNFIKTGEYIKNDVLHLTLVYLPGHSVILDNSVSDGKESNVGEYYDFIHNIKSKMYNGQEITKLIPTEYYQWYEHLITENQLLTIIEELNK